MPRPRRAARQAAAPLVGDLLASPLRNLLGGVIYMLAVMAAGTAAYAFHGWSVGDAFFMVLTTVYTVGYGEVRPVDTGSLRLVTVALIVFGCTGMIFLTGVLVQAFTLSQVQGVLRGRRVQKDIDALKNHVIVCGFGRLGEKLCGELRAGGAPFVVIEQSESRLRDLAEAGYPALQGDATTEDALHAAGIGRAVCLATVLPNDAANVFITLSARALNPSLTVIARAEAPSTESKLLQAGASRVILPTHIGAERIAELILYPRADALLHGSALDVGFERELHRFGLDMEVIAVAEGSFCVGRTVQSIEKDGAGAFLIVALARRDGGTESPPAPATVVQAGDGVVIVGHSGRSEALAALFRSRKRR